MPCEALPVTPARLAGQVQPQAGIIAVFSRPRVQCHASRGESGDVRGAKPFSMRRTLEPSSTEPETWFLAASTGKVTSKGGPGPDLPLTLDPDFQSLDRRAGEQFPCPSSPTPRSVPVTQKPWWLPQSRDVAPGRLEL
jgi:hypothetical protein